jgi:hypothetical protein
MAGDVNGDGVAEAVVGAFVQHYLIYGQDTAAPTAALTSAPSVASTATDFTKYVFQVTYTDAGRLQRSTLDNSDIEVVAPNGAVIPAQLVSVTPGTDAGTLLATYSIAAPGGQFTVPNGGTYTIRIRADQVSDHGNNFVAAGDLGTFRVDVTAAGPDTTAPTATLTSAPTITRATTDLSQYTFQVTYQDNERVKVATLDNNDIAVIAANGTAYSTQLVSAVPNTDAGTIVATYRLSPPRDSDRFTPADRGTYTIRMAASQVSDQAGNFVAAGDLGTFQIAISLASADRFAVGPGAGGNSPVTVRDVGNNTVATADAFPGFTGGVRVAEADVDGDGTPDLIVGTGPGVATQVKVISGTDGATLFTVQPFEASFTGGVYVAAGDINGDGKADVIVTPDEGGGPVVAVYDGAKAASGATGDAAQTVRFLGIDDPNFRGGARAAVAEVGPNGPAVPALVVAAGFGGGPRVAVFNGDSLASTGTPKKLVGDFFVFEPTLRNGVFVTAGDLNGDGFPDVIVGGGPGGGPRVFGLSGKDLLNGTQTQVANFFAGDAANRGGIRLTAKDLDGDGKADLVTGAGDNAGSQVTAYAGKDIAADGTPGATLFQFDAVPGFANGVYVG